MKALALVFGLFSLGCTYLVPDYKWRSKGKKYEIKPEVWLHLGNAPQLCAGKDGLAQVTIFANLYNFPPQKGTFTVNDKVKVELWGKDFELFLAKVGIGSHVVEFETEGYHTTRLIFSVWECS